MDAKGDTHYRGNAVLVPTFLALYFFFSFFAPFCAEETWGYCSLTVFF